MQDKTKEVVTYVCLNNKKHISTSRLAILVFLFDWFHVLERGEQYTDIVWKYEHGVLDSDSIKHVVRTCHEFMTEPLQNSLCNDFNVVLINSNTPAEDLLQSMILKYLVDKTMPMNFEELLAYMYASYPFTRSERMICFDLKKIGAEYNAKCRENNHL